MCLSGSSILIALLSALIIGRLLNNLPICVFYNIGNYAQAVRNFACFKKVYLFAPKNGGAVLAGGKRLPPTEAKRRQGVDVIKSLFYFYHSTKPILSRGHHLSDALPITESI